MKKYLITGGTGLIGTALCKQLVVEGNHVTVLSRSPHTVKDKCGGVVKAIRSLSEITPDSIIDVVINLAGEPIAKARWTNKRKAILESSRINLTRELVDWMVDRRQKPDCLISGSAIGWYGAGGEKVLTEQSDYHDEYTHQLCDAWEKQALRAGEAGIRVCLVRTGLVLASTGGVLQKMLLPFKLGLGGRLGSGEQYMPWIHISDMINVLGFLASNEHLKGIFNACAPNPVTNRVFTHELASQLGRYAFLHVPAWVLSNVLGEMSRLLLVGQKAMPEQLMANGFSFSYSELAPALSNIFNVKEIK